MASAYLGEVLGPFDWLEGFDLGFLLEDGWALSPRRRLVGVSCEVVLFERTEVPNRAPEHWTGMAFTVRRGDGGWWLIQRIGTRSGP